MLAQDRTYFQHRERQEQEAAQQARCEPSREAHRVLARLYAERQKGRSPIALHGAAIETMIGSLHHTFGENDLLVARRQQRVATGEALVRWTEIVERLEARRDWLRIEHRP